MQLAPDLIVGLGDLQYEKGAADDFSSRYALSWGTMKDITFPVPGNHEYVTEGASGYYSYFEGRQPGSPGYYSFTAGAWRIYALNSNCSEIDCAAQEQWLHDQVATDQEKCSIVAWHHPVFNSGVHGNSEYMLDTWRIAADGGAEILLVGHEHAYERFAPMNGEGSADPVGLTSFTVGTGGKNLYRVKKRLANSKVWLDQDFGVLVLDLHSHGASWSFESISGKSLDAGSLGCHA